MKHLFTVLFGLSVLLCAEPSLAQLEPSISFGHEAWPSATVSNVEVSGLDGTSLSEMSVWTDTRFVRASYPFILNGGRTFLDVQPGFQRIQFRYSDWAPDVPRPTDGYVIDLTVIAQHQLSRRWALVTQIVPAVKSGLDDKLARDDFAIEGAVLATKRLGEKSALGFGIAYSTNFGLPIPIPLLQYERRGAMWDGGPSWRAGALLPSSLELWVVPSRRFEVGVQLQTLGNRHHLATNTSAITKPYSDYFDTVFGPSAKAYITPWLSVGVDSGFSLYRQMQITDGRDEVVKFEPNRSGFVRWQLTIGGSSPLK